MNVLFQSLLLLYSRHFHSSMSIVWGVSREENFAPKLSLTMTIFLNISSLVSRPFPWYCEFMYHFHFCLSALGYNSRGIWERFLLKNLLPFAQCCRENRHETKNFNFAVACASRGSQLVGNVTWMLTNCCEKKGRTIEKKN